MNEKYKKIAFTTLIETVGKDFVMNHSDNISFSYSENEKKIDIAFLLSKPDLSSPKTKSFLTDEKPFERYFSLTISKKTEKCSNIVNKLFP